MKASDYYSRLMLLCDLLLVDGVRGCANPSHGERLVHVGEFIALIAPQLITTMRCQRRLKTGDIFIFLWSLLEICPQ